MTSILLVDDNEDLRILYAQLLRRAGHVVREAEDGARALEVLEQMDSEPCLLLLDQMMPVMTGTEVLKVLRDSGRFANLPIIVLSATSRPPDVPEGQNVVRKPVDPHVLVSLVQGFLASKGGQASLGHSANAKIGTANSATKATNRGILELTASRRHAPRR
jgi:CheY-like chemotaxis protein